MIITEQKELDEILRSLEGHERVFLVGCGICAATWGTGGEQETREMAARLAEAGKDCTGWIVTEESTCDARTTRRLLKRNKEQAGSADALLVLSCGAGVQTVASLVDVPVYPALNTLFLARIQNLSVCDERCRLCGACILAETAAICPVTLCPKGLMNGPCGGYEDGRCPPAERLPRNGCNWCWCMTGQISLQGCCKPLRMNSSLSSPSTLR